MCQNLGVHQIPGRWDKAKTAKNEEDGKKGKEVRGIKDGKTPLVI